MAFESLGTPVRAGKALTMFSKYLTAYEQSEILDYKNIYYLGLSADKAKLKKGFDDEKGFYTLVEHDHIAFRYEIGATLGKGSFGVVVKALDHKKKQHVALKIIRNKKRFHR